MDNYELIAFYLKDAGEVSAHAHALRNKLNLEVRFEKLPKKVEKIREMATRNSLLAVFSRDAMSYRRVLKYAYHFPNPVLLVSEADSLFSYAHLKLPIGFLKENKEKVVWANFIQRRNNFISLELIVPTEANNDYAYMVESNAIFIENILDGSDAQYRKTIFPGGFNSLLTHLFKNTAEGVLLIMRPYRFFSWWIPTYLKLYEKFGKTQIMLVPHDEELYIPCH
ncbi:hypothetical protein FACS1894199_10850 [Bacteroidia bacterium]|nr:hypothetical protein FACS1894199_10850 [Bacteroidia bacterium]